MVFLSVKSYSSKQTPLMHGKIPIYEVSNKKKKSFSNRNAHNST